MFNHFLLAVALFALSVIPPADDYLSWTKSQCRSIVKKYLEKGNESFGAAFGKGMFGQGAGMGCLWLTDRTSKAIARVTQLEERQTDSRAEEILANLRKDSNESFSIIVFPTVMRVLGGGGPVLIFDANPERLSKIFLEYADDQSKFARAYSIEPLPFDAKDVFGVTPYSKGFLIRFHRTLDDRTPLIKDLKQKIRFRLPTDAGTLIATFKLADMGTERAEDF